MEIDVAAAGWRNHGHLGNPEFSGVILRVIWEGELRRKEEDWPPVMTLKDRLDSPLGPLSLELGNTPLGDLPGHLTGVCAAPLSAVSPELLQELLLPAAQNRLSQKAARITARARQSGWEQSLWEALFRALGYKRNEWPMHCVAEALPRLLQPGDDVIRLQSRLLGVAGLLPSEPPKRSRRAREYWHQLWDHWWREREALRPLLLPSRAWRQNAQRPANHPQRRLALAAHWLMRPEFFVSLENWFRQDYPKSQLDTSLVRVLCPEKDRFWSRHWSLGSRCQEAAAPLLGVPRATDLAMNAILPWFWARASTSANHQSARVRAEYRYYQWPTGQDNAVLRLARKRLLGNRPRREFGSEALNQGLLQIVRDFCSLSNAACEDCPFPQMLRRFMASREQPLQHPHENPNAPK